MAANSSLISTIQDLPQSGGVRREAAILYLDAVERLLELVKTRDEDGSLIPAQGVVDHLNEAHKHLDSEEDHSTSELLRAISGLTFETKKTSSDPDDSYSVAFPSVCSSSVSSSPSRSPRRRRLHARKLSGICGEYLQCAHCRYWSFSDRDMRRHETRVHPFAKRVRAVKDGRVSKYGLRVRAEMNMGICGEYLQCKGCQYWSFGAQEMRRHQLRAKH